MSFGTRLKQLRTERRLNQSELGEILGLTNATISAYENETRTPDIKVAQELAKFFNVSVDSLLDVKSSKKIDLKELLRNQAMTYNGEEISEHDLAVLEGVVKAFLEKKGVDTK
ncbi:helix-turn-helix domain-containing protein [Aerococcaceae bacterium NML190073]|nr:helix-turn-helix domain-containing protein [Aerococcaceae bacterium NML190073]